MFGRDDNCLAAERTGYIRRGEGLNEVMEGTVALNQPTQTLKEYFKQTKDFLSPPHQTPSFDSSNQ